MKDLNKIDKDNHYEYQIKIFLGCNLWTDMIGFKFHSIFFVYYLFSNFDLGINICRSKVGQKSNYTDI